MELSKYKTWFFDCDGVLLDSNQLKSESFYEVALPYGKENAQDLVEINKRLGGVTRFEKFKYFFETILEKKTFEKELENALNNFSALVCKKLISCPETSGVRDLLDSLPTDTKKYVVSGGAQTELRAVFKQRGLDTYFDGIFGSPDSKEIIMSSRMKSSDIVYPAVFIGDSRYDYEVASQFNLDFFFMTKYTEFEEWKLYFADKRVKIIESFNCLCFSKLKRRISMKAKQNILVTGGAGFIGSCLSSRLIAEGCNVVVIDNLSTGFESNIPQQAEFFKLDISKEDFLNKLPKIKFDYVFHLAAQSSGEVSFEDPAYDVKTNVVGTLLLLNWAMEKKLKRFIYTSSMSIYGDDQDLPVKETAPPRPLSFYGVGKLASEKYADIFIKKGLPVTTLRLFNVYGPGQNMENLKQGMVSIYMAYIAKDDTILVKGSRDRFRDFIYIDDVVDAFIRTAFSEKAANKTFNVGTGKQTFVWQLLDEITKAFVHNVGDYPIQFEGSTLGDQIGIYADISEIKRYLSWEPKVELSDGLVKMVKWLKANRK